MATTWKTRCITSDLVLFSNMLDFSPLDLNFLVKHYLQAPFRSITSSPLATDGPFLWVSIYPICKVRNLPKFEQTSCIVQIYTLASF